MLQPVVSIKYAITKFAHCLISASGDFLFQFYFDGSFKDF